MTYPLTVYKASAGSGKTFRLAVEYIKLLVMNPQHFRNILAVTFTNKATEEMKMRIISQMYGILMQYSDSKSYRDKLCEELECSEEFLRKQVKTALTLLLHNYSFFRVETIDSFFQRVLRNLARELDLTANLRIELNDRQVEELAVDRMIDDLKGDDEVMQWIMDYIYDNMQEDKSWNVIGQIKNFGTNIFKDFYKDRREQLEKFNSSSEIFKQFVKALKDIRDNAQEAMKQTSVSFFESLDANGLSINDFAYGKSGLAGLFVKIADGPIPPSDITSRALNAVDNPDKWVRKKHERELEIKDLVNSELNNYLKYAVTEMPRLWKNYQSAQLSLRHLYQLRLLDTIENKVRQLNDDAGRFLLCDTQHLLQSLINDNDSPFIFEKIGAYLEYIMIDEFQDTSVVQWQNFKILLSECMSHVDSRNLIVGDVKQSIYRWRSGAWRLLNDIDSQFGNSNQVVKVLPLSTNFRSNGNVIDFNNKFFVHASEKEYEQQKENCPQGADQLKKAYSDVVQGIPDTKKGKGKVSITLLPSADYQEEVLNEMADTIFQLLEQGVKQSNIAILVRTNSYIPLIANYFIDNHSEINIVSDEAYRLDSSVAVRIIVEALHLLTHPDDVLSQYTLVLLYQTNVMDKGDNLNDIFLSGNTIDELLPKQFMNEKEQLLLMPLYDLAERLCKIFDIEKIEGQTAYICTFLDELTNFATNETSDINSFIAEWEKSIHQKTICGDKVDGIRILSIHKSKGLEYDNVIVPYCDWQLEKSNGNIIWCSPEEEPYSQLKLLPVDYNKKSLLGTIFEKDYQNESLQNTVDNLNLLYVAFTRASRNLFVIGKRNATGTRSTLIQNCLPMVVKDLNGSTLEGEEDENAEIRFEFGELDISEKDKEHSENVLLSSSQPLSVSLTSHDCNIEFKQSNKSRDFIESDEESTSYIKQGCLYHYILSQIRTVDDIDAVVDEMVMNGIIDTTEISKSRIVNMLHKRIESPQVKNWFAPGWTLYNECTLLRFDEKENKLVDRRPDRVISNGEETIVIDFKFGKPKSDHTDQVTDYIRLLRDMGMKNVTGYLWYVYKNNIVEVKA